VWIGGSGAVVPGTVGEGGGRIVGHRWRGWMGLGLGGVFGGGGPEGGRALDDGGKVCEWDGGSTVNTDCNTDLGRSRSNLSLGGGLSVCSSRHRPFMTKCCPYRPLLPFFTASRTSVDTRWACLRSGFFFVDGCCCGGKIDDGGNNDEKNGFEL